MATTFQPTTASAAVEGLVQVFDPGAATGVDAVILLELTGREPGQWTIVVRDGLCHVIHGRAIEPTLTLRMGSDVWLAIARGERRAEDARRAGDCEAFGDDIALGRFERVFPVHEHAAPVPS
jgi:hypothetical protein